MIWHILDRAVIHFFSSCGVLLCVVFAIRWAARKWPNPFLPKTYEMLLTVSALLVFAFSTLREAVDVSNGQTLFKAFCDYASWLLGCGVSAFGLYRIKQ